MPDPKEKICPICGRSFAWRKRWARHWEQIVYCSDRCRGQRGTTTRGDELEARILDLLAQRARGATICPSEVVPAHQKQDARCLEDVRAAARRLVHRALIDIVQRGVVVDPNHARGPIRLRQR